MLPLFAQRAGAGAGAGGNPDAAVAAMMASLFIPILIGAAIGIAIQIFFCLTLSKALQQVRPKLREMEPGQVWLLLIPLFNLYWVFVVTGKVPESLKSEFYERGMRKRGDDYGANLGKWYAICMIASIIPCVGSIIGLVGVVMWIMFWVKIAGLSKELREDRGGGGGRDDDDDDDYDDEPRPRKKRRDDYDD